MSEHHRYFVPDGPARKALYRILSVTQAQMAEVEAAYAQARARHRQVQAANAAALEVLLGGMGAEVPVGSALEVENDGHIVVRTPDTPPGPACTATSAQSAHCERNAQTQVSSAAGVADCALGAPPPGPGSFDGA